MDGSGVGRVEVLKMAEATEEIVKVFLEQKGYLVQLSKRVDAKHKTKYAPRAELDLVAVFNGKKEAALNGRKLPKRIIGEVKSERIHIRYFKELYEPLKKKGRTSKNNYGKVKWVNDKKYRKEILEAVTETYGGDFKFVIFCGEATKNKEEIKKYLEGEGMELITHAEILKSLFDNSSNEYTNNQVLQLIRLIKTHRPAAEDRAESEDSTGKKCKCEPGSSCAFHYADPDFVY